MLVINYYIHFNFFHFLIFFSTPISNALGYNLHPEYALSFIFILAFDALTTLPFAKLRQEGRAKKFAFLKFTNIILNISINLLLLLIIPKFFPSSIIATGIKNGDGIFYVFIANLIASVFCFIFLLRDLKSVSFNIDKLLSKQILFYAFPLLIAGFAGMINETLDRAILKYLIPDKTIALSQLGIYSACYKLSILLTLFVQTFRYAAEPFFFAQKNKENNKIIYANVMNYFVFICSLIFLIIMLFIDVIKNFIGDQFHSGLNVVPILLLANLFLGIYLNLSMWYKLSGKTKYGAWFSIIGAFITITLNFILIPKYGYTGAAWATLVCYFTMMMISYFKGQKVYPIPYSTFKIVTFIFIALLLWQSKLLLINQITVNLISDSIINAIFVLLYIGLLWKMLRSNKVAS